MKPLYLLILFYIGLCLSGCSTGCTTHAKTTQTALNKAQATHSEKNPISVAMFTEGQKPSSSYKVLGTETVSKFNYGGIKRQTASIHDAMRSLAAKMGGDAVINIAHDDKTVTGTVISYEQPKVAA